MQKTVKMIKETILQDNNVSLIRIDEIEEDYDCFDDEIHPQKIVVCIDAEYKQQIFAVLGDIAENIDESVDINTFIYYDNGAHATIEIIKTEWRE